MNDTSTAPGELRFTRVFEAPRELVFRCMIDPDHLRCEGWRVREVAAHLTR
jgi:uncharacterized protein YndB with AHSA1/START domain